MKTSRFLLRLQHTGRITATVVPAVTRLEPRLCYGGVSFLSRTAIQISSREKPFQLLLFYIIVSRCQGGSVSVQRFVRANRTAQIFRQLYSGRLKRRPSLWWHMMSCSSKQPETQGAKPTLTECWTPSTRGTSAGVGMWSLFMPL